MMTKAILLTTLALVSCGGLERQYDAANYESLTNETGTIHVYSGGKEVATYEYATVLYADSDSQCMWIRLPDDRRVYIKGDLILELDR